MEPNRGSPVATGHVCVKIRGILKDKQLLEQWAALYQFGQQDNLPCIELFEQQEDIKNGSNPSKSIVLENPKWVDRSHRPKDQPYIEINTKKEKYRFNFDSEEVKEVWVQCFCCVSTQLADQRSREICISDLDNDSNSSEPMVDNCLYDSTATIRQISISIDPTMASERNHLKGHYFLEPTSFTLRLLDESRNCVHEWQYKYIRKYGRNKQGFNLEVGRKCTTGEGNFKFFTLEGDTLFSLMNYFTSQLKSKENVSSQNGGDDKESTVNNKKEISSQELSNSARSSADSKFTHAMMQRSSSTSNSAPRKNISPKQQYSGEIMPSDATKEPSSETKIYQTSSGLTAPLNSNFKQELHTLLHLKLSDSDASPVVSSGAGASPSSVSQMSWKFPSNEEIDTNTISGSRLDGVQAKEKRKSDKEDKEQKKKREKEQKAAEARAKKEQKEREREQKEREKAQKERDKKQKKEKDSEKQTSSKLKRTSEAIRDGHIYDEPENIQPAHPVLAQESLYAEAVDTSPPPQLHNQAVLHSVPVPAENDVYATPHKPRNAWKKHAISEPYEQHESYSNIKMAAKEADLLPCPLPPELPPNPRISLPVASSEYEVYDHLGTFNERLPKQEQGENVYGLASATNTVRIRPSVPVPSILPQRGDEYEDTTLPESSVAAQSSAPTAAKVVSNEYRETNKAKPAQRTIIRDDGEYADIC